MFKEIRSETGVHLYEAADGDDPGAEGESLPKLAFPSGTCGRYVWDMSPSVVAQSVSTLLRGCRQQGMVLGLDCEWELSLGGAPPNPVSTVQLSLPGGTAYCFQLQRGERKTTKENFPIALKLLLEDSSIRKVRINIVEG